MRSYDDFDDDDLLDDDDELDTSPAGAKSARGGGRKGASSEDSLGAKYADYLMWRDTGSSHDEALDLANLTEDEFSAAEAQEDPEGSNRYGSLDDDDDDLGLDDEDSYEAQRRSRRGGRDDDDDY
ncbi:hypothetical protein EJV47_05605 [Hymenobacter gummosus]|uniref:Uncharacterized protein n=1 Tax=Hymenobacter gummosus TaxID=1776032 RepID=A0A3S0K7Y8_9BACT|nr:hypothetical protein [Hymenobacter gummosus]RTQ52487.1 hypothetical protein EJV47_05605 [Hymenobacter gummosus]